MNARRTAAALLALPLIACGVHTGDANDTVEESNLTGTALRSADEPCPLQAIAFAGDSTRLVATQACDSGQAARSWPHDMGAGAVTLFTAGSTSPATVLGSNSVAYAAPAANGSVIGVASGTTWQLYDAHLTEKNAWHEAPRTGPDSTPMRITGIRPLPDGKRVLLMGSDSQLHLTDGPIHDAPLLQGATGNARLRSANDSMDLSADGSTVVFAYSVAQFSNYFVAGWATDEAQLYIARLPSDVSTPTTAVSVNLADQENVGAGPVAIDGAGHTFVFAPLAKEKVTVTGPPAPVAPLQLRSASDGRVLKTFGVPVGASEVGISRDGAHAFAAGVFADGFRGLRVFQTASGAEVLAVEHVTHGAFAPDGASIALATAPLVTRPDGVSAWRVVTRSL